MDLEDREALRRRLIDTGRESLGNLPSTTSVEWINPDTTVGGKPAKLKKDMDGGKETSLGRTNGVDKIAAAQLHNSPLASNRGVSTCHTSIGHFEVIVNGLGL
ncbi:unnamed protein product [Caenorhabditis auriculariae]|uniref:Uncharacterized protein n=1 Tax=Caenorhabditis auriculariae TaxID=2777116 RepID=A0A8S1H6C3_9PELO|nr:unnamed protein product [Caenorhabditis auriculariae]